MAILTITDPARDQIIALRNQDPEGSDAVLLIEITGVRGDEFAYGLSFVPPTHVAGDGHLIEQHGDLSVAIDSRDQENLIGAVIDLTSDGLAMENPNRPYSPMFDTAVVGTLEGPLAEQVATVLAQHVNPAIASHGGAAELVGVQERDVFLRLLGGCQGCGLASVTLQQGIEQILRQMIPDLGQIVDVTDHASGTDPYYASNKK